MTGSTDKGQLFEAARIELDLHRQTVERVEAALDFIAMNAAVDDGDIDARFRV